jgi:TetR/AcrR family transcriptional regulator
MTTRETILTTATALFARGGFEGIGTQEICRTAGITKPTLYHHFANKETLFREVAQVATTALLTTLSAHDGAVDASTEIGFTGDLVGDIRALFAAMYRFSREEVVHFRLLLQLIYPPQGSVSGRIGSEFVTEVTEGLTDFFGNAADAHGNLRGKETFLATLLLGQMVTLAARFPEATADPESPTIVLAAQTFLYGVF